jgi:diguanylate cyclase (GGDEF)-like protein
MKRLARLQSGGFGSFRKTGGGLLRRLDDALAGTKVPPDLTERIYLDQAADFSYIMMAIVGVGLTTDSLMYLDFYANGGMLLRTALLVVLALCYAAALTMAWRWLKRVHPSGAEAKRYIGRMIRILIILSLIWAALITDGMHFAKPEQRSLLYGIVIGCIAAPVLVAPISCALASWIPTSIGICLGLAWDRWDDRFAFVDLLSFIALTGFCIVYLNRRMNERAIGAIRLEENSEVIKLLLRDFEESASDWLWETNAAMQMQRVSQRLAQVLHRPAAAIQGRFPHALLGEVMNDEYQPGAPVERLLRLVDDRSPFRDLIIPVVINGELRYWSLTGKPCFDKFGRFSGYHGVGSDITGQRRQQEQIAFLARHDSLTKLPNRVLFGEILHQACARCETSGFALLCLDLDLFKMVNDTLGHPTGDGVLIAVAERLRGCIRDVDTAARLGGDEFGLILDTEDIEEAAGVAARIIERVSRPYYFDGKLVHIGISIGITMAPRDAKSASTLMKNADLALYRAKVEGKGIWRLYDPAMDVRMQERRSLQSALRQALTRNELCLEYQPVLDLAERRIIGAEALLRWRHPERGLLLPGDFIELAEETGLIGQVGEWVLNAACAQAAKWPEDISIAVNLSPLQFRDPGLVDMIDRILSAASLSPARLELEITETTMLETSSETMEALWRLHTKGVRIALDDFGTGYSSLSYLRRFPFDKIKIDRSFIRDLGYEKDDSSIILAIIGLAERMNMTVTAEGVETQEQAVLLNSYGCAQAQGYLFHRPVAPELLTGLIGKRTTAGPDWAQSRDWAAAR